MTSDLELDAVVLDAGVAELHQLREQGLRARAHDSAADVGGTWFRNRYPGSRFDSEGCIHQHLFSEELYKNWSWIPHTFTGFEYFEHVWEDCSPQQRQGILENVYQDGSLKLWPAGFGEIFFFEEINQVVSEFVRDEMRARPKDPRLIDILVPSDYGFGTTMGLMVHGYPNLLTTAVPLAPSAALCNMTTCLQQQTEWISGAIRDLRAAGKTVIEPTTEGEEAWIAHHEETANATIVPSTTSWYLGSNVPGKPRRLLSSIGGVGTYRQKCEEAEAGYPAFSRS